MRNDASFHKSQIYNGALRELFKTEAEAKVEIWGQKNMLDLIPLKQPEDPFVFIKEEEMRL